jgi:hypothetical protein
MRPQSCAVILLIAFSLSCHPTPGSNANAGGLPGIPAAIAQKAAGVYTGNFNKGLITLVINYISGKNVSGYDIHKGLRRNVNGVVRQDGSQLDFVLKEPGGSPYDGTFYFSLDTTSLKIKGKWVPLDSSKITTEKLALSRKEEGVMDIYQWTTAGGRGDTTLTFNENGSCEYSFYERAHDSTSQLITVRGNFDKKADTFKIEWQKNSYTPLQAMKLVKGTRKIKNDQGDEYESDFLRGQGWEFVTFEGD